MYTPNSGEIAVRRFIIALRLMGSNLLARCGAKLRRIADAEVLGASLLLDVEIARRGKPPYSKMISPSKKARVIWSAGACRSRPACSRFLFGEACFAWSDARMAGARRMGTACPLSKPMRASACGAGGRDFYKESFEFGGIMHRGVARGFDTYQRLRLGGVQMRQSFA